jgi:hypothetical protein
VTTAVPIGDRGSPTECSPALYQSVIHQKFETDFPLRHMGEFRMRTLSCLLLMVAYAALCAPIGAAEPLEVDCRASPIVVSGAEKCWRSEVRRNALRSPYTWHEDTAPSVECVIRIDSVQLTPSDGFDGFVRLIRLQPGAHMDCVLWGRSVGTLRRMRSIATIVSGAPDLTFPRQSGDRFLSDFSSPEGRRCIAFIALGPTAPSRHPYDHRAYRLEGFYCAPAGAALAEADVGARLGLITVRVD